MTPLDSESALPFMPVGRLGRPCRPARGRFTHDPTGQRHPGLHGPRQIDDAASVDFRADAYALGGVLFEALLGRRPFVAERFSELIRLKGGPPPTVHPAEVPVCRRVWLICSIALMSAPEQRPASYAEIADALAGLAQSSPSATAPRRPGLALFGGLGLVALLAVLARRPWALPQVTRSLQSRVR